MRTCPDCGERVYNLGCTNCNEVAYIEEQDRLTDLYYPKDLSPVAREATSDGSVSVVNDGENESD